MTWSVAVLGAVALAVSAVFAMALAVAMSVSRRRLARRLDALLARLIDTAPAGVDGGARSGAGARGGPLGRGSSPDAALARLEWAAGGALARLAQAEETALRLGEALDRVSEGVVVGNEYGEVVFRNQRAAGLVGARHGDALTEQAVAELLAEARTGEAASRTLELFGPPRRTVTVRTTPLGAAVGTAGAVAVIDDVTERRRHEAVRRDFVANLSHELKTPVGAVGLLAETLLAETLLAETQPAGAPSAGQDVAVVHRLAGRLYAEAMRMGRIIDDLLDLSRIEADEQPSRQPLAVPALISQAVERARPMADHRGITLEVVEQRPGTLVLGDRRQLVSALHNLLENGVKYSDEGSTVVVSSRGDDEWVEVAVQDRGIGIPARDLERIFERFYRVDRARARDTGGTGLGLAIVRHVVGNHRGEVRVESREGEGSTFFLRLPAGSTSLPEAAEAG